MTRVPTRSIRGGSSRYWSESYGDDWEHGLPIGNGSLGALVFGRPEEHRITVSHERVVLPADRIRSAPLLADDLGAIRELIRSGNAQAAADLGVHRSREQGYPGLQWTDPLVPVATIMIPGESADAGSYRRDVDLGSGVSSVTWQHDGQPRGIRAFVGKVDQALVVEVTGPAPAVELVPPGNVATSTSGVRGGNERHVTFESSVGTGEQLLETRFVADWDFSPLGATTRLIFLGSAGDRTTFFAQVTPLLRGGRAPTDTAQAPSPGFAALLAREASVGARARVGLDLRAPSSREPIERLLELNDDSSARELIQLQFQSTQAAIDASTGELPPTLQGVWSGSFDPAWSSDYTMNGNVQNGSIASMLATGHPEQLRSYLDMIWGFRSDFAENARRLFGTEGWVLPSRCSPTHGKTTHFDERHCHEFWTSGGGWAALSFFDYVWHTGDLDYLRDVAYPFGCEVERFYAGFIDHEDGYILFSPSYSPENRSPSFGSQACRNATMDRAVLERLLTALRTAARLLDDPPDDSFDDALDQRRSRWLEALPPYRIAPDGTLAEWLDDGVIERVGHRTASQLLGLWFEPDRAIVDEPTLSAAVASLIEAKLSWRAAPDGVEEMAYGLVQLGVAASTIGRSEAALECVSRMSQLYFLPSLATTHDVGAIFNVDIAGGFPAVICSMLVGSSMADGLALLPALPDAWPAGSVSGIHTRGAVVVELLEWSGEDVTVRLRSLDGSARVRRGEPLAVSPPPGFAFSAVSAERGSIEPDGLARIPLDDGVTVELVAHRRTVAVVEEASWR